MDRTNFTEDDEGKSVMDANGDEIGMVNRVHGGDAFVDPDPGITDAIRSKLGWGQANKDEYRLESYRVDQITDDEIHLKD